MKRILASAALFALALTGFPMHAQAAVVLHATGAGAYTLTASLAMDAYAGNFSTGGAGTAYIDSIDGTASIVLTCLDATRVELGEGWSSEYIWGTGEGDDGAFYSLSLYAEVHRYQQEGYPVTDVSQEFAYGRSSTPAPPCEGEVTSETMRNFGTDGVTLEAVA